VWQGVWISTRGKRFLPAAQLLGAVVVGHSSRHRHRDSCLGPTAEEPTMIAMSARRLATAAAVTLGLLGAAAAVPAVVSATGAAPAAAALAAPAATSSTTNALLTAINDARLHPEKYPPHGSVPGATMAGCANPLTSSAALYQGAAAHDRFLASHPLEWITRKTAHMDPNGKQATDDGGHIAAAGFNRARAEIVATQMTTSAAAVRAWMQDDGDQGWGHRNIILDCKLVSAGASHYVGGPGGHYYTADMGTR
jgi:hypothetical protein